MLEIEVSREASRCGGSCRIGRRVVKLCAVYGIAPGLSIQQSRGSDREWCGPHAICSRGRESRAAGSVVQTAGCCRLM